MQKIQWFTAGGGGGGGTSYWTANGDDIYNNNSGFVGIGTTAPSAKLEVKSAAPNTFFANFIPSTGSGYVKIYENSNSHPLLYMGDAVGTTTIVLNSSGVSYLTGGNIIIGGTADNGNLLQVQGTGYFSGNVGIGTNTPTENLQVSGNILANLIYQGVKPSVNFSSVGISTSNQMLAAGGINLYSLVTAGHNPFVGFKNAADRSKIEVWNGAAYMKFGGYGSDTSPNIDMDGLFNPTSGSSNKRWLYVHPQIARSASYSGNAYGIYVDPNFVNDNGTGEFYSAYFGGGNVGIGTTTPTEKLHVVGKANINDSNNNVLISTGNTAITASNTTAVGYRSLTSLTTGDGNTSVGVEALRDTTTGLRNTVVGVSAAATVNTSYNAIFGYQAGQLFGGDSNTAMGYVAGKYSSGERNALIGAEAGEGVSGSSSFSNTVAVGYQALTALTTGAGNTAVGHQAGVGIYTGSQNTLLGFEAGVNLSTESNNTILGRQAGRSVQGGNNVIIGASASSASTTANENVVVGYRAGENSGSSSNSIYLGANAGASNTTSNRLFIDNSSTAFPLIYGEFDTRFARVNGDFYVRSLAKNKNVVTVQDSQIKFNLGDTSNDNQAVTITRDGSTSTDVVALKIGSNITIKRNGGGTPTFTVGNGGFIYTQTYNGDTATNTNPFNNGAGMGVRNTVAGSKVILALYINGVFGALNSATATLQIGNPAAANDNWTRAHSVFFRNHQDFTIEGTNTNASEAKRYIFRYRNIASALSAGDYRLGVQISGIANQLLGSLSSTQCTMTNGSNVVTLTTGVLREYVAEGATIYFNTAEGGLYNQISSSTVKYTITSILSTTSFTISGNWTGTDGINVYAWLEPVSLTVRNWNKDEIASFYPDGKFQVGAVSTGYTFPALRGSANAIITTDGSGNLSWSTSPTIDALTVSTSLSSSGTFGFNGTTPSAVQTGYTATAVSSNRIFDASTVTLSDLANVMANLVNDLVAKGLIAA